MRASGMKGATAVTALLGIAIATAGSAADPTPLVLEDRIALGAVAGRIDHFAFDAERRLLFVAELGNNSVSVVDLKSRKLMRRLPELTEPQGLAYHAATDTLYVANAGDGSVRLYQGGDFAPQGRILLGDDADNVRIDSWRNRIVVGYGKGALAVIDPGSRTKIGDIA